MVQQMFPSVLFDPAVVNAINNGCVLAPIEVFMVFQSSSDGCVCSSSNKIACALCPCCNFASADNALYVFPFAGLMIDDLYISARFFKSGSLWIMFFAMSKMIDA